VKRFQDNLAKADSAPLVPCRGRNVGNSTPSASEFRGTRAAHQSESKVKYLLKYRAQRREGETETEDDPFGTTSGCIQQVPRNNNGKQAARLYDSLTLGTSRRVQRYNSIASLY
jgi:hypothetical protein